MANAASTLGYLVHMTTEDPPQEIPYPRGPGEPAENPTPDGPIPTEPEQ
jgi:hypothetical protein